LYFQVYFPTRDSIPWANWDVGPPDIHAHCPSCSGTCRLSLLPTSLPPHAETHSHTLSQHLQAFKTDEPPIREDQGQLVACLWVPALTSRQNSVKLTPLLPPSLPPHAQTAVHSNLEAKQHWYLTTCHLTYSKLLVNLVSDLFPMTPLEGAQCEEWPR